MTIIKESESLKKRLGQARYDALIAAADQVIPASAPAPIAKPPQSKTPGKHFANTGLAKATAALQVRQAGNPLTFPEKEPLTGLAKATALLKAKQASRKKD